MTPGLIHRRFVPRIRATTCSARPAASAEKPVYWLWRALDLIQHVRTGCPWRYLPHDGFPPRSTVYNIFRGFQRDGVWEAIWADLHADLREAMGREASPTAAALDSQSLKSAEKGAAMITA